MSVNHPSRFTCTDAEGVFVVSEVCAAVSGSAWLFKLEVFAVVGSGWSVDECSPSLFTLLE